MNQGSFLSQVLCTVTR